MFAALSETYSLLFESYVDVLVSAHDDDEEVRDDAMATIGAMYRSDAA